IIVMLIKVKIFGAMSTEKKIIFSYPLMFFDLIEVTDGGRLTVTERPVAVVNPRPLARVVKKAVKAVFKSSK
ncbi:MAG: hypothetical protein ACO3LE_11295, partial [Bdellovibrionota bacterium]